MVSSETPPPDVLAARRLRRLRRWWFGGIALVAALILVAGVAGVLLGHPRPGHPRNTTVLMTLVVLMMLWSVVVGFAAWRFLLRDDLNRQLRLIDWRTRRRVGVAVRKGRPIPAGDAETARLILDAYRRPFVLWVFPVAFVSELLNGAVAHGVFRWTGFAFAAVTLGYFPFVLRQRTRVLSRGAQIVPETSGMTEPFR